MTDRFQIYSGKPSAIISGGVVTVPLHAVTGLSLSETYEPAFQDLQREITTTASDIARLDRIGAATQADRRGFARELKQSLRGQ